MVNGITAVGAYLVTKAVTVGIEEIFSWEQIPPESTIRHKIRALYDRCLNSERRIAIRFFWKDLPLGICAFLIDKDDVLFNLGRLSILAVIINPTIITNPATPHLGFFFNESSFMTDTTKIIIFTCIISVARLVGVCFCNYLRPRVPPPFNNILGRLQNGIDTGIGSLGVATYNANKMERFREYKAWRDQAIRDKVFPLFQQFLEKSAVIENFLCPLTQDLITIPVRDPKGRIYERNEIFAWIDRANTAEALVRFPTEADRDKFRLRASPYEDMALTKADLTYDTDYHNKVSVALKTVFDQQIDQRFREGLLSYQSSMIHDPKNIKKDVKWLSSICFFFDPRRW